MDKSKYRKLKENNFYTWMVILKLYIISNYTGNSIEL